MEKEQHRPASENQERNQDLPKAAAGQQLPTGSNAIDKDSAPAKEEQHSESSLPQKDNETLGTP